MSFSAEDKTFSMVDFFLYLAPGVLILLGLFFFIVDIPPTNVEEFSKLAISILAIIFAYILGHAVYPLNFIIRNMIHRRLSHKKDKKNARHYEQDFFNENFEKTLIAHPEYCLSQLLRYRSLSRFLTALVLPSIFFGCGVAFNLYFYRKKSLLIAFIPILLALMAIYGFLHRYKRYWYRIVRIMTRCNSCPERKNGQVKKNSIKTP